MSELSIADRVAAGVAWLDEHDPGWWRVDAPPRPGVEDSRPIDLDALQMADPCGCILGHRYGSYYRAPTKSAGPALGFDHSPLNDDVPWSPTEWGAEWPALTDEWARVITARRAEVTADA